MTPRPPPEAAKPFPPLYGQENGVLGEVPEADWFISGLRRGRITSRTFSALLDANKGCMGANSGQRLFWALLRPDLTEHSGRKRYEFFMWRVELVQDGSTRIAQRAKRKPISKGSHGVRLQRCSGVSPQQ